MTEKVVLIGAGSAMFTRGLTADMIRLAWDGELCLVDTAPGALAVAEALCRKMIAQAGSPLRVSAFKDRREALPDATLVVTTIAVGGRKAWEADVVIPRKYGIFQPVGDTCMPGGTSRALRMIPPMVEIAEDVLMLAPQALFFNYGNPMSAVCRAVRKATGANMVGLCHGVHAVALRLAQILGVEPERLRHTAVGINHLTWFTDVRVDGQSVMAQLRQIADEKLAALAAGAWEGNPGPFCWQMLKLFGAFPAVYDRHVTEFFPHLFCRERAYFGMTLGVDDRIFGPDRPALGFEYLIEEGNRIFADMRRHARSKAPVPESWFGTASGEHEQLTDIVEAIRNDRQHVFSANLPNRGQVANLPTEAVLECPAATAADGLHAMMLDPLSHGLAATLAGRLGWVETTVDAALAGSRRLFVQALLVDGAVPSLDVAERLADDLLAAHTRHLPYFRRKRAMR